MSFFDTIEIIKNTLINSEENKILERIIISIGFTSAILYVFILYHIIFQYKKPWPLRIIKLKRNLHYLYHPNDLIILCTFYFTYKLPQIPKGIDNDWIWCYQKLYYTSRTFCNVILELHNELSGPMALFYLTLRALDTIEDDMKSTITIKKKHLIEFYTHLEEDGYNLYGFGDKKHEIDLLENHNKLINAFKQLKPKYKEIIKNICQQMGNGMAEFLDRKIITVDDYELYCHYVAGLVGYGFSSLLGASGIGNSKYGSKSMEPIANSMGLFLHKTHVIREYLDDISEMPPRIFWPKQIWEKYITCIQDFTLWENKKAGLLCLNELVTDALKHTIDCLDILKDLTDPSVFKSCAIPQVMAISTLELCYNNYDVFLYEVKISKGEAVRLLLNIKNYKSVVKCFKYCGQKFLKKISKVESNSELTRLRIIKLLERCETDLRN